jgi:glycyl-tRNA synthetase
MAEMNEQLMEKLAALCKRRGFIFQSSEIYGGINGFWDYGPLGVELKRNVKAVWWEDMVRKRSDMVGLDSAIIMNPKVWEASGHVVNFNDPLVDCTGCRARYRADQIFTVIAAEGDNELLAVGVEAGHEQEARAAATAAANSKTRRRIKQKGDALEWTVFRADHGGDGRAALCPNCGAELTEARKFNMMFKTFVGAMEDSSAVAYLRPETAQGIFANYRSVLDTSRIRVPFGIAQIGKAFRNEINPRNYIFRSREFEQMEIEFFCHPSEADAWYRTWRDARFGWYVDLGLTSTKLRLRDHEEDELAHYAASCADVEYEFPFGVSELEGIANRTDYDLSRHQEFSGRDMTYYDDQTKERFVPYVIEPSGGVDRAALAFLCEAYTEDEAPDEHGKPQPRTLMKFHPRLAPIKLAVFPLVKREGMPEIARRIYSQAAEAGLSAFYDEKGAVGRRYRRQDEAGTPFCATADGQSLEDGTVTLRDRDTLEQVRVPADEVVSWVQQHLR